MLYLVCERAGVFQVRFILGVAAVLILASCQTGGYSNHVEQPPKRIGNGGDFTEHEIRELLVRARQAGLTRVESIELGGGISGRWVLIQGDTIVSPDRCARWSQIAFGAGYRENPGAPAGWDDYLRATSAGRSFSSVQRRVVFLAGPLTQVHATLFVVNGRTNLVRLDGVSLRMADRVMARLATQQTERKALEGVDPWLCQSLKDWGNPAFLRLVESKSGDQESTITAIYPIPGVHGETYVELVVEPQQVTITDVSAIIE